MGNKQKKPSRLVAGLEGQMRILERNPGRSYSRLTAFERRLFDVYGKLVSAGIADLPVNRKRKKRFKTPDSKLDPL